MKMVVNTRNRRFVRYLALALGAAMLLWVPLEDTTIRGVLIFAILICSLAAVSVLANRRAGSGRAWLAYPLVGTLAGLGVTPVAFLLAAFKTGLHGHEQPDFTPDQIQAIFNRAPVWALSGLLLGLGLYLLRLLRKSGQ